MIGIYTTDEYGVKTLKEDTEILTQYLPEEDIANLKAGVEIIGNTNLIEFLEDYEWAIGDVLILCKCKF